MDIYLYYFNVSISMKLGRKVNKDSISYGNECRIDRSIHVLNEKEKVKES